MNKGFQLLASKTKLSCSFCLPLSGSTKKQKQKTKKNKKTNKKKTKKKVK